MRSAGLLVLVLCISLVLSTHGLAYDVHSTIATKQRAGHGVEGAGSGHPFRSTRIVRPARLRSLQPIHTGRRLDEVTPEPTMSPALSPSSSEASDRPNPVEPMVVLFGSIWLCGCALLIYFHWIYHLESNESKENRRRGRQLVRRKSIVPNTIASQEAARLSLAKYISSLFPPIFEASTSLWSVWEELCQHHAYLSVLFHGRHRSPEMLLLKLLSLQTLSLFLLALLYDMNYPSDDDSCEPLSADECLNRQHSIGTGSYCKWDSTCKYSDPQYSSKAALFFFVIVMLVTSMLMEPLNCVFQWLSFPNETPQRRSKRLKRNQRHHHRPLDTSGVNLSFLGSSGKKALSPMHQDAVTNGMLYLIAKPKPTVMAEDEASAFIKLMQSTALTAISARTVQMVEYKQRLLQQALLTDTRSAETAAAPGAAPSSPAPTAGKMDAVLIKLNEHVIKQLFRAFKSDLNLQRSVLSAEQRVLFDEQWCLNNNGNFHFPRQIEATLLSVDTEVTRRCEHLTVANDRDVGLELLQLFVVDLLGRNTPAGCIFVTKCSDDFERVIMVNKFLKLLLVVLIMLINILFIYFSIHIGLTKGLHWQTDYVRAWIAQCVLDGLLFETLFILWMQCALPYCIKQQVQKAYGVLQRNLQQLYDDANSHAMGGLVCCNAPEYLFVSHRMANVFPDLLESSIVRCYSSPLPVRTSVGHNEDSWWAKVSLVSWLLTVACCPQFVHKIFIRLLLSVVICGLGLAFYFLDDVVLYLALFSVFVLLLFGLFAWDFIQVKRLDTVHTVGVLPDVTLPTYEMVEMGAVSPSDSNLSALVTCAREVVPPAEQAWTSDDEDEPIVVRSKRGSKDTNYLDKQAMQVDISRKTTPKSTHKAIELDEKPERSDSDDTADAV